MATPSRENDSYRPGKLLDWRLAPYDLGAAVEWEMGRFSIKGVAMAIGSNGRKGKFDESYNAYFMQLAYAADSGLGHGNYRLLLGMSSDAYPNPAGTHLERRRCAIASFDQELGDILGAWIRFGWQDDAARWHPAPSKPPWVRWIWILR